MRNPSVNKTAPTPPPHPYLQNVVVVFKKFEWDVGEEPSYVEKRKKIACRLSQSKDKTILK